MVPLISTWTLIPSVRARRALVRPGRRQSRTYLVSMPKLQAGRLTIANPFLQLICQHKKIRETAPRYPFGARLLGRLTIANHSCYPEYRNAPYPPFGTL